MSEPESLHLITPTSTLRREGRSLRIKSVSNNRELSRDQTVPIHLIGCVFVWTPNYISPAALTLCNDNDVPVVMLSFTGRPLATSSPIRCNDLELMIRQRLLAQDDTAARGLASSFIRGKLENSLHLLTSKNKCAGDLFNDNIRRIQHAVSKLNSHRDLSIDEIMGTEGAASRAYFSSLSSLLNERNPDFGFTCRSRRPPRDPANAALSFLYRLLQNQILALILSSGLSAQEGFLHGPRKNRMSLVFDLMEEFRSVVADRLLLKLVGLKQITAADFTTANDGAVYLNSSARMKLVLSFKSSLEASFKRGSETKALNLIQAIEYQIKRLRNHVLGHGSYQPYSVYPKE